MADDKELARKDLAIILKLNTLIDYSQKPVVEKYYRQITQNELLTTPIGKEYRARLEQIINGGSVSHKCLFCDAETPSNTMICPACMTKSKKPSAVYCKNCGSKMNAGSTACPTCGKNRDAADCRAGSENRKAKGKKHLKRNLVIAFAVFFLLAGIAGALDGSGSVDDNVLDYIGTKESAVYQTYDKNDFYAEEFGGWTENERTNKSGLPHIQLYGGKVVTVILESGMNSDFNVSGLHIGDNVNQVEVCMKKLKASAINEQLWEYNNEQLQGLYGSLTYSFQYDGKDMNITIKITGSTVERISVMGPM